MPQAHEQQLRHLLARHGGSGLAVSTVALVAIGIASFTGLLDRAPDAARAIVSVAVFPILFVFVIAFVTQ